MLLQVAMDRERGERQSIESQLRDARREAAELQARYDAHSAELNARYNYSSVLLIYKYIPVTKF